MEKSSRLFQPSLLLFDLIRQAYLVVVAVFFQVLFKLGLFYHCQWVIQ